MAAADKLRQSLSCIGRGDPIEERAGRLIMLASAGACRGTERHQRLRPRQVGAIRAKCSRAELVMPLISRDFAGACEIDAMQAQAVDLGNCCAITTKHQSADDNRANSGVKHGDMRPGDAFAAAVETDTLCLTGNIDTLTVLIRLLGDSR